MEILQIVIGIVIGLIITVVVVKVLKPKSDSNNDSIDELKNLEVDLSNKNILLAQETREKELIANQLAEAKNKMAETEAANAKLIAEKSSLETTVQSLQEQHKEVKEVEERFQKEFELIANRILKNNSETFNQASKNTLDGILSPLKEQIGKFEKEINDKYLDEAKDKASLKQEIQQLINMNNKLSTDATNLTNALTGSNKHQGNWGEVILERVLERSGLQKGSEFKTQEQLTTNDGAKRIPDAVIFLPDDKHIIIDSKVSLTAYQRMVNAESEIEREKELKLHVTSLKSHIKELGDKNYFDTEALNSPDFTLMFLPIEASFSIALRSDTELFNYAWERNIVIVSPTTLLATLQTVASTWKHEKQNRNVLEIAKQGGQLYDKFVSFVDDLEKIERGIKQSQSAYDNAYNKLKSGRGNIVSRSEKLKALGAKAQKSLSSEIIQNTEGIETNKLELDD